MIATLVPSAPAHNVTGFARRVRDESAGNAFFVCELLDHLATTGQLERLVTDGAAAIGCRSRTRCATWSGNASAGSPAEAEELLSTAAVIGLAFDLDLVAEVVGRPLGPCARAGRAGRARRARQRDRRRALLVLARDRAHDAARADERHPARARPPPGRGGDRGRRQRPPRRARPTTGSSPARRPRRSPTSSWPPRATSQALAYESAAERYQQVHRVRPARAGADPRARGTALARPRPRHAARSARPTTSRRSSRPVGSARKLRDPDLMADAALASIFPGSFFTTAGRTETGLVELCEDALDAPRRRRSAPASGSCRRSPPTSRSTTIATAGSSCSNRPSSSRATSAIPS